MGPEDIIVDVGWKQRLKRRLQVESRIGKIKISKHLIDTAINDVADILSILKFVPLRVEQIYISHWEMIGYSHMFKEIDVGEEATEYEIHITRKENEKIKIEIEEVEEI